MLDLFKNRDEVEGWNCEIGTATEMKVKLR
jgi:hypothetical protein